MPLNLGVASQISWPPLILGILVRRVEESGRPRWPHKPETVGPNPTPATTFADLAHLVEQGFCKSQALGSIPRVGSICEKEKKENT